MKIGSLIKTLRKQKGKTQERFAEDIGVSIQTVSRWEHGQNYPDISMLPVLADYFEVSTDYLLGVKGKKCMAKLLKTTETFELPTVEEAKQLVDSFEKSPFPKLVDYSIEEKDGVVLLHVTKEFGVELDRMQFNQ